jgi:hypothetical protein
MATSIPDPRSNYSCDMIASYPGWSRQNDRPTNAAPHSDSRRSPGSLHCGPIASAPIHFEWISPKGVKDFIDQETVTLHEHLQRRANIRDKKVSIWHEIVCSPSHALSLLLHKGCCPTAHFHRFLNRENRVFAEDNVKVGPSLLGINWISQ